MTQSTSYPKNKINVLLLENIHNDAKIALENEGYTVSTNKNSLDENSLIKVIKDVHIIGIRSKTQLPKKVIEASKNLIAIGAFCIGTNQIDVESATENGVSVFNAPYSNTRSVVELAIAEVIILLRNLPNKIKQIHQGVWEKSAHNSFEVRGKTMGIVGYGNIGSQLSILAENIGMNVQYYDIEERLPLGNAEKCESLESLLKTSDVVSLHIDGRNENKNLIDKKALFTMKKGSVLINLSRGNVVDIAALQESIESKHLLGVAIDVFPVEPQGNEEVFESPLRQYDNVILTPHIGGSTFEAQKKIADFVPSQIIDYISTGSTTSSINFPRVKLSQVKGSHRLIHIHNNSPGVLSSINHVITQNGLNILGQHLKTNEKIGYLIADVDKSYDVKKIKKEMKSIDNTIWFRSIY